MFFLEGGCVGREREKKKSWIKRKGGWMGGKALLFHTTFFFCVFENFLSFCGVFFFCFFSLSFITFSRYMLFF